MQTCSYHQQHRASRHQLESARKACKAVEAIHVHLQPSKKDPTRGVTDGRLCGGVDSGNGTCHASSKTLFRFRCVRAEHSRCFCGFSPLLVAALQRREARGAVEGRQRGPAHRALSYLSTYVAPDIVIVESSLSTTRRLQAEREESPSRAAWNGLC